MLSQKKTNLPPYPPHLKNVTALPCKMQLQNFFHLTEGNVAFHHARCAKFSPCRNKTLPKLVRVADWCSIHALLWVLQYASSDCTKLIFIEPGAKINRQYYRDVLLTQKQLPAIRSIAGDVFVFHQDNALAHRARDRVELLCRETPQFISPDMWPANSPDLSPVDYCVCGMLQERMHRVLILNAIRTSCGSVLLRHGLNFSRARWTMQLISGEKDCKHVSVQKVVNFNTCCDLAWLRFQFSHTTTGSFQSHQCLEERIPSVRSKSLAFYKVMRWHFAGVRGFVFFWLLR